MRKLWRDNIFQFNSLNLIFVDESHFDFRFLIKPYGYFKKGSRAECVAGHVTISSYSIIMAQSSSQVIHTYMNNTSKPEVTNTLHNRDQSFIYLSM